MWDKANNVLRIQNSVVSGFTVNANSHIVTESNSDNYFEIASGSSSLAGILFSDSGGWAGNIRYDHSSKVMSFYIEKSQRLVINEDGNLDFKIQAISGREKVFEGTVSDASGDAFAVVNGTRVDGRFMSTLVGAMATYSYPAFALRGALRADRDSGTHAVVQFEAVTYPNGEDYLNPASGYSNVST